MPCNDRRNHLLGLHSLTFSNHSNFFVYIKTHDDGAPECYFFRRIATNDGVLHVEELIANIGLNTSVHVDTLGHPSLEQIIFGRECFFNERRRHGNCINFFAAERQPHRLWFFNDAHLDAANLRHFSALHLAGDAQFDRFVRRRLKIPYKAWKFRIGFEDNFGAPNPFVKHVRPCSNRVGHDAFKAILFNHLARHSAGEWAGQ